ncbi:MAG: 8-amino-7-oxononanoate synthase [Deltaproteobacteria bacterium]|jgi:8-amino-7-oxononanoate synthase|nr:8-amino-7-oxononanoate synthase [Deltaproteobacteria bacterium]MBW2532151.1 8-amino-7-oxononanoate synthase [Deltaproteobacteria bacterium]
MPALAHLARELAELERQGLLRVPATAQHDENVLVLCSNDYLGYGAEPLPEPRVGPSGSGASRLVCGDHPAHRALERELADWVGLEDALLLSSGYAANVGTISALAGPDDRIISDARNHASIIDGCRLSGARVTVTPHVDAGAVEQALGDDAGPAARRTFVITESYFSMDGTTPDLARLRRACDERGAALVVDEAHGIGVFGPEGGGLCRLASVVPDVLVGTLGKSLGLQGAFVAGSGDLRRWLWNRARTFIFSTGVSPWLARAALARVARARRDERGRARLFEIIGRVRGELRRMDAPIKDSHGPILFWTTGEPRAAVASSQRLLERGVFVQAIRPPTVPVGEAGLRITVNAVLSDDDLDRALAAFAWVLNEQGAETPVR